MHLSARANFPFTFRMLLGGLMCGLAYTAQAARPFVTDDARLTFEGSCQLESWTRLYPDSWELWALPACNPTGNLEVTLGGGIARNEGEPATRDIVAQVKSLARPLDTNGWGWGVALGMVRHPDNNPGPNVLGSTYAYLPFSFSFDDDRWVVHVNAGWLRERKSGHDHLTWGLGGEFRVTPRLLAIAETFGDNHHAPYYQLGARYAIIPDLFQIDATLGAPFSGAEHAHWFSFGIRLTPQSLF